MINHKRKSIFVHIPKTAGTSICEALGEPKDHSHSTIAALIEAEGEKRFLFGLKKRRRIETYFKYAFVRNPWDRMVSLYFEKFQTGWLKEIGFTEYIKNVFTNPGSISEDPNLHEHAKPCNYWISRGGKIICDFVGRFEHLESDFSLLCQKLSLSNRPLKVIRKRKREHYRSYYNAETQAIVAKYHRADIDAFGYRFFEK